MRIENGNVIVEYTDVLLVASTYIRRYKFTNENRMPDSIVFEIPITAWDLSKHESCLCVPEIVEGNPPEQWFQQAIKHDLQEAPAPIPPAPSDKPYPPPQTPINTDSMVVATGNSTNMVITPREQPTSGPIPKPQSDESPVEMMSGEIEDFDTDVIPVEELSVDDSPIVIEESTDAGQPDDSIPSGHERAGEYDRAAEAIRTANTDAAESDGHE